MKNQIKRKRNIAVTVRMNESEYSTLQNKVEDSGLTQQAYIINAIKETPIVPSDEIAIQKEISKTFAEQVRQLRGLATNINQMAHIANGQGYLPTLHELEKASECVNNYRKESEKIWQSIRSSINQQNPMAQ